MPRELVLITGMSGSGKSVALNALEDIGYFCIDNLPPELLMSLIKLELKHPAMRLAVAMDARSATSLHQVPELLVQLRQLGLTVQPMFFDANTDTLVRRFSETRRRHPLSQFDPTSSERDQSRALMEAIEVERELLAPLRDQAHVIDTSLIRAAQLQDQIKLLVAAPGDQLTLVLESIAFKRDIPADADYVFDVRMLPNPHYEPELKALTGQDVPVVDFMDAQPDAQRMLDQIEQFLQAWLPALRQNHRSYVTVAIGCTGGQHRSVYFVEQLARRFGAHWNTIKRHRELDLA